MAEGQIVAWRGDSALQEREFGPPEEPPYVPGTPVYWKRVPPWWVRVAEECPRHAPVADHRSGFYAHGTIPYAAGLACVQNARLAVGWIPGWCPTLRQAVAWVRDRAGERTQ